MAWIFFTQAPLQRQKISYISYSVADAVLMFSLNQQQKPFRLRSQGLSWFVKDTEEWNAFEQ